MPGWASPARPAVYKPPVGARVASPQSPILRWSTPRVSALDWATSGLSKSPLLIARPLLLTTNCPLLLTTAVRFCSHRDTFLGHAPGAVSGAQRQRAGAALFHLGYL